MEAQQIAENMARKMNRQIRFRKAMREAIQRVGERSKSL